MLTPMSPNVLTFSATPPPTAVELYRLLDVAGEIVTFTPFAMTADELGEFTGTFDGTCVPLGAEGETWSLIWEVTLDGFDDPIYDRQTLVVGFEGTPPSLLTVARARSYLLLSDTTQDTMLEELIAGVEALMTGAIGSALVAAEVTEEVYIGPRQRVLNCRNWPISHVESVVDPYGGDWDTGAFVVRGRALRPFAASPGQSYAVGLFGASARAETSLDAFPALLEGAWVVTYTGGLDQRPDWTSVVKPSLAMAALQEVSDWYNIRTARSTAQREGDMSHNLEAEGVLSKRCMDVCLRYSFRGM